MKKNGKISKGTELLIVTILAIGCSVFFCLVVKEGFLPIIVKYEKLILWSGEFMLFAFYGLSLTVFAKNLLKWKKLIYSAYILIMFCLVLLYVMALAGFFEIIRSIEDLRAFISKAGKWTWFVFIALQFFQVVLLPIPGFMSTTVGIALFGAPKCFVLSLIGIELGSLLAFIIGRKLGYRAVSWIVGKDNLDNWLKKMKGRDAYLLTLAFLFPFFPDDILCFVAGLSSMKFTFFAVMSLITRAIAIAANCFSVKFIPFSTWWGILIWIALIAALLIAFILIYKNLDAIQEKISRIKNKKS